MISIAIVDDCPEDAEKLASTIKRYSAKNDEPVDIRIFKNGFMFLDGYKAIYDVVFLDIEMPNMDGMKTARLLRKYDDKISIIFSTNIAQYAIHGYEVDAMDYFLKPVNYLDIQLRMDVIKKRKKMEDFSIVIPYQGGAKRLTAGEIVYVESQAHLLTFHTTDKEYVYRGITLKQVEDTLSSHGYYRCNSCYLINLKYCTDVMGNVVIVNGQELQVSRSRKKGLMLALLDTFGG